MNELTRDKYVLTVSPVRAGIALAAQAEASKAQPAVYEFTGDEALERALARQQAFADAGQSSQLDHVFHKLTVVHVSWAQGRAKL